jgi:hypothetical protein
MVLSQVLITNPTYAQYNINLFGDVIIKFINITYIDTLGNNVHDVLYITSSVLNFAHSSIPALIISNKADHAVIQTSEPPYLKTRLSGNIDFTIEDYQGNAPSGFFGCIITMDIIPLEEFNKTKTTITL